MIIKIVNRKEQDMSLVQKLALRSQGIKLWYAVTSGEVSIYLDIDDADTIAQSLLERWQKQGVISYIIKEEMGSAFTYYKYSMRFGRQRQGLPEWKEMLLSRMLPDVLPTVRDDVLAHLDVPKIDHFYKPLQFGEQVLSDILETVSILSNGAFLIDVRQVTYSIEKELSTLHEVETLLEKIVRFGAHSFASGKYAKIVPSVMKENGSLSTPTLMEAEKSVRTLHELLRNQEVFFTSFYLLSDDESELQSVSQYAQNTLFKNSLKPLDPEDMKKVDRLAFLFAREEVLSLLEIPDKELFVSHHLHTAQDTASYQQLLKRQENGIYAENEIYKNLTIPEDSILLKSNEYEYALSLGKNLSLLKVVFSEDSLQMAGEIVEKTLLSFVVNSENSVSFTHISQGLYRWMEYLPRLKKYGLYTSVSEIGRKYGEKSIIERIVEEARERSDLLGTMYDTIEAYNQQAFIKEKMKVFIIHAKVLDGLDVQMKQTLFDVFDYASKLGFMFVIYAKDNEQVTHLPFSQETLSLYVSKDGLGVEHTPLNELETIVFPKIDLETVLFEMEAKLDAEDPRKNFLSIPIGFSPELKTEVSFELGSRSDTYHAFIVGTTGTGKTTLLNNLILRIAEQYTAQEMQLILMDFKSSGVEFNAFKNHPNVQKLYLDNQNFSTLSEVFQYLKDEMARRNAIFKKHGVSGINAYRALGYTMPNILLIVDEIQKLFSGSGASVYLIELAQLVKESRTAGIALIFATQTLNGLRLDKVISQIRLRVSFQLASRDDLNGMFDYNNTVPLYLNRFECIYNTAFGITSGNIRVATYGEYKKRDEYDSFFKELRSKRSGDEVLQAEVYEKDEEKSLSVEENEKIDEDNYVQENLDKGTNILFEITDEEIVNAAKRTFEATEALSKLDL